MKIREKFLLIITAVMLIILLISYGITYSYFYTVIFKETMQNQRINVELNRRMANNFLESHLLYSCTACQRQGPWRLFKYFP